MAQSAPKDATNEKAVLKMQEFVQKMGSVKKAKEALETLDKIKKAA